MSAEQMPVPAGLVVLVGPPASGKTAFVRELVARGSLDPEAVVSSDAIRAELFGDEGADAVCDAADARIFDERDRRIAGRLAAGRTAVAESTNVTPRARARLAALAERFGAPVTVLRFPQGEADLLRQNAERPRDDVSAADVRAYAALMRQDANEARLRAEGAAFVYDVPGRGQGVTPAEAARRFTFRRA
ncbi:MULTISPECIES: ATP-binding protein [unclassified Streptomyces]|uniref:ATP-binding protein n=1 Tax=unclassified Streptomyces TaxID=2593676 RepID=UPI002DDA2026|nr:ATP-binding protein [Streptomyces sp. NBC_01257]WRZ65808.1 ATP-binding protein [Streptomyces sp. NBC_01257]WSU59827.1 ATP-binding protein [Streptomyces sp. NBC_01104]